MSDRIPPLTPDEIATLRREGASLPMEAWTGADDHAIAYAIQQSRPKTEADVEAVARAIVRAVGTIDVDMYWRCWIAEARAAIRTLGHTVEGDA